MAACMEAFEEAFRTQNTGRKISESAMPCLNVRPKLEQLSRYSEEGSGIELSPFKTPADFGT